MNLHTWRSLPLLVLLSAGLTGCYMPKPVAHAKLTISANSQLAFNGAPVASAALAQVLDAAKPPGHDLIVQIEAAPDANLELVRSAVAAVKLAHARVAFSKDYSVL